MNALETFMKLWIGNMRLSHPDSHVSNIGIFWAFHEYKSWISGVFNDDFFCYFSRSYRVIRKVQLESLLTQDRCIQEKDTYQLLSLWWETQCRSIHLCRYQSGQISGRQSEAPDPRRGHLQWCHSTRWDITRHCIRLRSGTFIIRGGGCNHLLTVDLQTCCLSLCIWQDCCRSVLQSLASHVHLYTREEKNTWLLKCGTKHTLIKH